MTESNAFDLFLMCSGKLLVVTNTHLYFHPKADLIRLLQMFVLIKHVQSIAKRLEQTFGTKPAMIACGDFNCVPFRPAAQVRSLLLLFNTFVTL